MNPLEFEDEIRVVECSAVVRPTAAGREIIEEQPTLTALRFRMDQAILAYVEESIKRGIARGREGSE